MTANNNFVIAKMEYMYKTVNEEYLFIINMENIDYQHNLKYSKEEHQKDICIHYK